MPLSDREKRLLDEMEAALLTEDPRLVSALSAGPAQPSRHRVLVGLGFFGLGLATLFGGLVSKTTPVGILGFIIALGGVIWVISAFSSRPRRSKNAEPTAPRSKARDRMEKRWDERNNQ